jgi:DNA-directed RNA polymerase subunit RPC12/RpoP
MIEYFNNYDLALIDGYHFRRDKKTGYYLSSKKIGGKRKRLHVYVWEKFNGEIPKGYHVHHADGDKKNNEIDNLKLLSSSDHAIEHARNLSDEERRKRSENVTKNAVPAAKEWHSTKEGYVWHSEHAKETMRKRAAIIYVCSYCGKEYESKHIYGKNQNHFCSNNCKAAYRRKSGIDNIIKICEDCGKEYESNKYQRTKYCRDCQNRRRYPR